MSANTITSAEAMIAKFPPVDDTLRIVGEPNLPRMHSLHRYMLKCARTHRSPLCAGNMICLVLSVVLFPNYSDEDYPTEMEDYAEPDPAPNYTAATDSNERAAIKHGWEYDCMVHFDGKNMNESLIARFISYLDDTYRAQWEDHCIDNSLGTPTFLECFQFFLDSYGDSDATDRRSNLERMEPLYRNHPLALKPLCISYTMASNTPPTRVAPSTERTL